MKIYFIKKKLLIRTIFSYLIEEKLKKKQLLIPLVDMIQRLRLIVEVIFTIGSHWSNFLEVKPEFPNIGSQPKFFITLIDFSLPSNHHKSLSYVVIHLKSPQTLRASTILSPICLQPPQFRLQSYLSQVIDI